MRKGTKTLLMDIGMIALILMLIFSIPMLFGVLTQYSKKEFTNVKDNKENKLLINLGIDLDTVNVFIKEKNKIEKVPLEEYVIGVVSSEMPASFEKEALIAQGILARTFVINKKINSCSGANGADICNGVHCQVYTDLDNKKKQWGEKGEEYFKKISDAVNLTKNMVLSYNGELVKYPQYFAVSSGKTEDAQYVFSVEVPYLKSVNSPGEEEAPKFKSVKEYSNLEFVEIINNYDKKIKLNKNDLEKSIKILNRNPGDTVGEVKLGGFVIKGIEFRNIFKLNSANFNISFDKNKVYIECLGYGHGVGMSQWGAKAMAKEGKSYEEILEHYFSGCDVMLLENIKTK